MISSRFASTISFGLDWLCEIKCDAMEMMCAIPQADQELPYSLWYVLWRRWTESTNADLSSPIPRNVTYRSCYPISLILTHIYLLHIYTFPASPNLSPPFPLQNRRIRQQPIPPIPRLPLLRPLLYPFPIHTLMHAPLPRSLFRLSL